MINVSISPDGEIVISQETPGERIYMGEHYAQMERESQPSAATLSDDERAAMFKQGWESAIRESQLQYVNGRIEDFWNEMGVPTGSEDPHHNEPEGTGEEWLHAHEMFDEAPDQPLVRPAVDSGEPDLEAEEVGPQPGVWTISDEELQSRLDAEFERGMAYVSATVPPRYTADQIAELRADAYGRGVADAGSSKKEPLKFAAIRGAFDRAVAEVTEEIERMNDELVDELPKDVRVEPDRTALTLTALFRQLGIEVTR